MTAMTRLRRQAILKQASGYIELGELLVEADRPLPASAARLLGRALDLLAELPEPTRSLARAKLLEGEALRALGRWDDALEPLRCVTAQEPGRLEAAPLQPILHYNLACYLSLGGSVQAAIEHLARAIAIDGRFRDLTEVEPDFDPIRQDPRFVAVTHVTV